MKRATITLLSVLALCFGLSAQAATSNQFTAPDPYTGVTKIYSVSHVQMITATPTSFVLQYQDGNSSTPFADVNYAKLTKLLMSAPALARMVQIGASGVYVNPDDVRKFHCQYGDNSVEATNSGDHVLIIFERAGWAVPADPGCAFFNSIKAGAN